MQDSTITSRARLMWDALETYGIDSAAVFADVGLSEMSAFSRSFRWWTGVSPSAYRSRVEAG